MANHPVFEGDGWMLDLGSLLDYGLGYRFDQGLIVSHAEHDASSVYDAVLFVPTKELLNLLKQAGLLPTADQLWSRENAYRNLENEGYPLNERGEYAGKHPLAGRAP